jgi:transcriptional regulator with XRE-family HTH domain
MAMDLKHRIGLRVKTARAQRGLTQEQLAELIGKTTETVSNIERGHTLPPLDTLESVAKHVGAALRDFFDDAEQLSESDRQRLELEARLLQLSRSLSPADLKVAVAQLEALAHRS